MAARASQVSSSASQVSPSDGCNPSITPGLPGLHPFILSQLQSYPRCWIGYFPIHAQPCTLWIPAPGAAALAQGTDSQDTLSASSMAWQANGPISQH